MTAAKRAMLEDIKLIDIVIEIVDARIPLSSRNPDIDSLAGNKKRVILLNKSDLADEKVSREWVDYFKGKGYLCCLADSRKTESMRAVKALIDEASAEKIERDRKRGILNRPVRAMICGIPNVGKSTFINSFAKKSCAKTGNKPGVTKGKQWVRLNKNVDLLDTPGILWPKFEDERVGSNLAFIGSINDMIIDMTGLCLELFDALKKEYPGVLSERYGIDEGADNAGILSEIAQKRGCLIKGGEVNIEKAVAIVFDEFRNGKLGRISLERPFDD